MLFEILKLPSFIDLHEQLWQNKIIWNFCHLICDLEKEFKGIQPVYNQSNHSEIMEIVLVKEIYIIKKNWTSSLCNSCVV